jgi:hypothetical protein
MALKAAQKPYKGDNKRQKVCYACASCKGLYSFKEVAVDHIAPAGELTDWSHLAPFVQRLFCDVDKLQVLCDTCHNIKTYSEKQGVTLEEATVQIKAIKMLKEMTKPAMLALLNKHGYTDVSNEVKRRKALTEIIRKGL